MAIDSNAKETILRVEAVPRLVKAYGLMRGRMDLDGWAGWSILGLRPRDRRDGGLRRLATGGGAFLYQTAGRWHVVIEGDEWCPLRRIKQVPYAIERDLLGCRK